MRVYVMRHGSTVWNEQGITQGRTNNELSQNGENQCHTQAENYRNTHFDAIISSPLRRTMQTAEIMNKFHNCDIITDKRIIELDQGVLTGRHKSTYTEEENIARRLRLKSYGLETKEELYDRCKSFVDDLKTMPYNNVLVITHGITGVYLHRILQGHTREDILTVPQKLDNAEVKEVSMDM